MCLEIQTFLAMYSEVRSKINLTTNSLIKVFNNKALQSTSQNQSQIDQYDLVMQKEQLWVLLMSWLTHTVQDYNIYFIMARLPRIKYYFL